MVLNHLEKYESSESQENVGLYLTIHATIKGLQFSHVFSALGLVVKTFSKLRAQPGFFGRLSPSRLFVGSSILGIILSNGLMQSKSDLFISLNLTIWG